MAKNNNVKDPDLIGTAVRQVFDAKYVDLISGTGAESNPFFIDVVDPRIDEDAISVKNGKIFAHYGDASLNLSKRIAKNLIKAGVENFILTLKKKN